MSTTTESNTTNANIEIKEEPFEDVARSSTTIEKSITNNQNGNGNTNSGQISATATIFPQLPMPILQKSVIVSTPSASAASTLTTSAILEKSRQSSATINIGNTTVIRPNLIQSSDPTISTQQQQRRFYVVVKQPGGQNVAHLIPPSPPTSGSGSNTSSVLLPPPPLKRFPVAGGGAGGIGIVDAPPLVHRFSSSALKGTSRRNRYKRNNSNVDRNGNGGVGRDLGDESLSKLIIDEEEDRIDESLTAELAYTLASASASELAERKNLSEQQKQQQLRREESGEAPIKKPKKKRKSRAYVNREVTPEVRERMKEFSKLFRQAPSASSSTSSTMSNPAAGGIDVIDEEIDDDYFDDSPPESPPIDSPITMMPMMPSIQIPNIVSTSSLSIIRPSLIIPPPLHQLVRHHTNPQQVTVSVVPTSLLDHVPSSPHASQPLTNQTITNNSNATNNRIIESNQQQDQQAYDEHRLRRMRNNEAVRKSRLKARMKIKQSELNCRLLVKQFGELKTKIQELERQLNWEKRKNEILEEMLRRSQNNGVGTIDDTTPANSVSDTQS